MLKNILIFFLLFLPFRTLVSQAVIEGFVKDAKTGLAIEGVIVKLMVNKSLKAFTTTNSKGQYRVSFLGEEEKIDISFGHISYAGHIRQIATSSQVLNAILEEKPVKLNEVRVKAPEIRQRGDTLSFLVSAFMGENDVSLEDAIKNLPGIAVSPSGAIQYQGKDISKFYIEGMDMLDGKYGLATKSLSAKSISTIDILENHQEMKQLRGRVHTDNVAMNVRLKQKTIFKPFSTSEASLGYGDEGLLYRLGLTGMLFSPKFQTICSAKLGNFGTLGSKDVAYHYTEGKDVKNKVLSALDKFGPSRPPVNERYYKSVTDQMFSINAVKKITKDISLKTNLDYAHSRDKYTYSTLSRYFSKGSNIIVSEIMNPKKESHEPALVMEYKLNDSTLFLKNRFSAKAKFLGDEFHTRVNIQDIGQEKAVVTMNLCNRFSISKLVNENIWSVSSTLGYLETPENKINYLETSVKSGEFSQIVCGNTFFTNEQFNYALKLGRRSRIGLPVAIEATYDELKTELYKDNSLVAEDVSAFYAVPSFMPHYEFTSPNNRFVFRVHVPFRYHFLKIGTDSSLNFNRGYTDAKFYLNYVISPLLKLNFGVGSLHKVGDVLDFLEKPIQVSYRKQFVGSGVLSRNSSNYIHLKLEYKRPLDLLFFNLGASHHRDRRNLLPIQAINGKNLMLSFIGLDNVVENTGVNFFGSKKVRLINTKLSLYGSYTWNSGEILQQGEAMPYHGEVFSLSSEVSSRPWRFLELNYSSVFEKLYNNYSNVEQSVLNQSHRAKVSIFPTDVFQVYAQSELVQKELLYSTYKSIVLCDMGIEYKIKSVRLKLGFNNLFNTKNYTYTLFSGLDYFSYDYRLRQREVFVRILFFPN